MLSDVARAVLFYLAKSGFLNKTAEFDPLREYKQKRGSVLHQILLLAPEYLRFSDLQNNPYLVSKMHFKHQILQLDFATHFLCNSAAARSTTEN